MMKPEVLRALAAAGATSDMLIAAIEADQTADIARKAKRRARDAERKRLKRAMDKAASANVLRTDAESAGISRNPQESAGHPSPPPSMVSPIPPSLTTTPSSPPSLRSGGARKGTRLPNDWMPSELDLVFAGREGLSGDDLRVEIMKFKNHWTGKAGKDAVKVDWPATWRNWVLNWKNFHGTGHPRNGRATGGRGDFFAGLAGLAADIDGNYPASGPAAETIPRGRHEIDL